MSTAETPDRPKPSQQTPGAPTSTRRSTAADLAAKPSLVYYPNSYFEELTIKILFPDTRPLEVELGSGDGSFLVQYALANPDRNFLGVERLLGRLRKIDRKGQRAGLTNLRVMRIEAGYFLEYLLPRQSVSALHVYFPDPWPKRKHRKHRLISPRFVELAARVLLSDGVVYLRTDDTDYFTQMRAVFRETPMFQPITTPPNLAGLLTDFERDFHARGIPSQTAAYQRVGFGPA